MNFRTFLLVCSMSFGVFYSNAGEEQASCKYEKDYKFAEQNYEDLQSQLQGMWIEAFHNIQLELPARKHLSNILLAKNYTRYHKSPEKLVASLALQLHKAVIKSENMSEHIKGLLQKEEPNLIRNTPIQLLLLRAQVEKDIFFAFAQYGLALCISDQPPHRSSPMHHKLQQQ